MADRKRLADGDRVLNAAARNNAAGGRGASVVCYMHHTAKFFAVPARLMLL